MPYDYHDQSIVNGNMHTLTLVPVNTHTLTLEPEDTHTLTLMPAETFEITLEPQNTHTLTLGSENVHTLTLVTPFVGTGAGDYNGLINKPSINNVVLIGNLTLEQLGIPNAEYYWRKDELIPITSEEIDTITGFASTVSSFMKILEASDKVLFDNDITFNTSVTITKNFTIDLGGQEIRSFIRNPLFVVNGGTLTLKGNGSINVTNRIANVINGGKVIIDGGSYYTNDIGFTAAGIDSNIEFNNGELTSVKGGISLFNGARATINDGVISVSDGYALFTNRAEGYGNNYIAINGGSLISSTASNGYEACCVYIANNDTFVMDGGSITGNGGCGLLIRAGHVTINNGIITALSGPNVPGYVDTQKQMNASAVIYDKESNFYGSSIMSLSINDGQFVGADHSLEVLSNELTPNITITGGDFIPVYPEN